MPMRRCSRPARPRLAAAALRVAFVTALLVGFPAATSEADVPVAGLHVVAETGGAVPGLPGGPVWAGFSEPVISETSDVCFLADVSGPGFATHDSGVFRRIGGVVTPVAFEGDTAPGTLSSAWKDLAGASLVTRASGLVVFGGTVENAGALSDAGLWGGSPGQLLLLARESGPAYPAFPGTLAVFADPNFFPPAAARPVVNASGTSAFRATLGGPGVTLSTDEALCAGVPGNVSAFVREGDPAPGAGGATYLDAGGGAAGQSAFGEPSINGTGRILFRGRLAGTGVTARNAEGIWIGGPGGFTLFLRAGTAAPGLAPGRTFDRFGLDPVVNDGDFAFLESTTLDAAGLNPLDGLWIGPTTGLVKVAARGDSAPSDPASATFAQGFSTLRMNGAGQAAFVATLSDGGAGIYGYDASAGLVRVARSGVQAPGFPAGESFSAAFPHVFLNAQGKVLFRGVTTPGGHAGLWIADVATGAADLLVRTGAATPVDGAQRTFTDVRVYSVGNAGDSQSGRATCLSDEGHVVFLGVFQGGAHAIVQTGSGGGGGGGGVCTDLVSCRAALAAALPRPSAATNRRSRSAATKLRRLFKAIGRSLDRGALLSGPRQARTYAAARRKIDRLVARATGYDAAGTLGVPLGAITTAAAGVRAYVP